jgi:hypothetical protein
MFAPQFAIPLALGIGAAIARLAGAASVPETGVKSVSVAPEYRPTH